MNFEQYVNLKRLHEIIAAAREEDLGPTGRDVTSELLVPAGQVATARIRSRAAGRLSGGALLPTIAAAYDTNLILHDVLPDATDLKPMDVIANVSGSLRSILAFERVALNFLTHLSGIASLTARYVAEVDHTDARIYDTRKTIPGFRELAKYAVVCGGGNSHRMGLYDAVLVKDNHIAHLPADRLADAIDTMVEAARRESPPPSFVEVEVDSLRQLEIVLACRTDLVLLDNMTPSDLCEAVQLRNERAPDVELEASGGVNLETVRAVAETGVDRIAIGALTHSAGALDIGMDIQPVS